MSEDERFRRRKANVQIFVTAMFVGAGVMFVAVGFEIARLF